MQHLVPSSGEVADCIQLNLPSTFQERGAQGGGELDNKFERPSAEPILGLSVLGSCRNMMAQHGRHTSSVDIKGSF